jgi:hypothetical protein
MISPLPDEDRESKLLLDIDQIVPMNLKNHYQILIGKRENNSLTNDEISELIRLGDYFENLETIRLQILIKLAQLRQISLNDLMETLVL